jgi:predicted AlkP superfamily phosphohydrolase/phosphomutase
MEMLAIGIDDADRRIITKMDMPFLQRLIEQNARLDLEEDLMSRGWAEFYTGRHASETRAFYDWPVLHQSYRVSQQFGLSTLPENITTIWDLLSQRGYRVGIMNVPTTMPAAPVNGFMVAGGGGGLNRLKDIDPRLCFPQELAGLLEKKNYIVDLRLTTSGIDRIDRFFHDYGLMAKTRTGLFIELCQKHKPDFAFLAYRALAIIQYLGMSEIEYLFQSGHRPKDGGDHPNSILFRQELVQFYRAFDQMLQNLFESLNPRKFILFSDHGKVPYLHDINYNDFLVDHEFQTASKLFRNTYFTKLKNRVPGKIKHMLTHSKSRKVEKINLPFIAAETQAFALGLINGIYINDSQRFGGPVISESDARSLAGTICETFNQTDEAKAFSMSASPLREKYPQVYAYDYLPDIWIDKPDTMRPIGKGKFVEENRHYQHIIDLTQVYDDNWTGIKGRNPLFITDPETARNVDGHDPCNLTIGYRLIDRIFKG